MDEVSGAVVVLYHFRPVSVRGVATRKRTAPYVDDGARDPQAETGQNGKDDPSPPRIDH